MTAVAYTLAAPAGAQDANQAASFSPPRLWDGKTPDFRGIWQARGTAYVNIEGHPGEQGIAASASIVVDPPDGKIPYRPDALAKRKENYRARATADPSLKCYQAGVPRATYLATPLQILQSPGNFAIVYQENHAFRVFHPDDRPHFEQPTGGWAIPAIVGTQTPWSPTSWRKTDQHWLDRAGKLPQHRFPRGRALPNDRRRQARVRGVIEDATVYSRPWTMRTTLHRIKEPAHGSSRTNVSMTSTESASTSRRMIAATC